jgi:hypothetical protein
MGGKSTNWQYSYTLQAARYKLNTNTEEALALVFGRAA